MREKRLRKQEVGEQLQDTAETEPSQNQTGILKRKIPAKTSPVSSEPTSTTPPKLCKLTFLKPEAAEASVPERPGSPDPESQSPSREVPDRTTSTPPPSTRLSRDAAPRLQDGARTTTTERPGVSKGTHLFKESLGFISNQYLTCSRH